MTPVGGGYGGKSARQAMQIVAGEDGTEVAVRVPNVGTSVERWTLNKNQIAQLTESSMLAGSLIETDKPVALFGGNECTGMFGGACEVLQQQIPPLSQWGSDYALVPYRPRIIKPDGDDATARENVPWCLVGGADGTVLTYEPECPGSAPATLQAGEVATFRTTQLLTVKSQDDAHPFFASVMMTGAAANSPDTLGDPGRSRLRHRRPIGPVPRSLRLLRRLHLSRDDALRRPPKDRQGLRAGHARLRRRDHLVPSVRHLGRIRVRLGLPHLRLRLEARARRRGRLWPQPGLERRAVLAHRLGIGPFASYGYTGGTCSRPLHPVRAPIPE